jgi:Formate/nitrite transporter
MSAQREPEQIYARARDEGRRRLARPVAELAATALVGGFDVAFGVIAFGLSAGAVTSSVRPEVAHLVGALAFGVGFVVVGKSELFTENSLVPVAGLERRSRASWLKLGELWIGTRLLNLVGGAAVALIVTSEGVLPRGSHDQLVRLAERLTSHSAFAEFLSAVVAGALMTVRRGRRRVDRHPDRHELDRRDADRPWHLQPRDREHDRARLRDALRRGRQHRRPVREPRYRGRREPGRRDAAGDVRPHRTGRGRVLVVIAT